MQTQGSEMSYQALEIEVIRWAEARQIIQNSNIQAQARKTMEEAGELLEAATGLMACKYAGAADAVRGRYWTEYQDALGDVLVTLIVGAATADVDLTACLSKAYDEIKDRKGHLRADGVFVKETK
jgi:NTP pyrophosphatase (non-canonical NTP hydrolase)